jgi:aminomethyltransferase
VGGGVLREHQAVRESVGIFDVSHLGKIEVRGSGALEFLNQALTNDLNRISDGQAQYTMICEDQSGGVIDDLIIYRRSVDDFLLVPNAANNGEVVKRLDAANNFGLEIKNMHEEYGVIALQGPKSTELLEEIGTSISLDYMQFTEISLDGVDVIICRTGYTGESGFEILPKWGDCSKVWQRLEQALIGFDGRVAGLGARDTLRTEMGYPLHGHELSTEVTPVQAGASWAVGWKKADFWGRSALVEERERGPAQILKGLRATDRGIPRAEMKVFLGDEEIGITTSGTFSPTLRVGIALAFVRPDIEIGEKLDIEIRGKRCASEVVKLPFVPSHVR